MNARIGLKLQVNATSRFHSLYDWCFQTMWLISGVPEDAADEAVMEKHGAKALYSAVQSLMPAIQTEDQDAQQDAAHRMIQIALPWTIRRRAESKLANGNPLIRIPKENAHLVDLEWPEEEQAKLWPWWKRTLHKVLQECGGYIDGGWHVSHWFGRHRRSEWRLGTMVQWMATWSLGGFSEFLMAEGHISANGCHCTCRLSRTWRRWSIKWGAPGWTWKIWKPHASGSFSSKGSAILPSSWPNLSYEVVAYKVFHGSFEYFLHVSGNGQQGVYRNGAQIPRLTKSLCIRNYTQTG